MKVGRIKTMNYTNCRMCPRQCGVDRTAGQLGFCAADNKMKIYRYGPHFGEEPPLVGQKGSGTVFFSHCTLACAYCQNYPWSQEHQGNEYTSESLAEILIELAQQGCHNWNLVSPTSWLPDVIQGVELAKKTGFSVPIVYNTSGFECKKGLESMFNFVDIFVTDLRYSSDKTALELSKCGNYVQTARDALMKMVENVGMLKCDEDGIAQTGVVCRLLILPGRHQETIDNLHWLKNTIGNDIHISLMSQYTPAYHANRFAEMGRMISREEYDAVCAVVEELEFYNGWIQEYIPESGTDEELVGYNMRM